MSRAARFFGLAVLLVAVLIASGSMAEHPLWTPDGLHYARATLRFRGESAEAASAEARRFFVRTDLGHSARYGATIASRSGSFSTVAAFFTQRIAYPALAALLYPAFGMRSLIVVSLISYVVAGVALYTLLLLYGPPWLAAAASGVFLITPSVRGLGASSLVDMLAIALWYVVLYAMLRFFARGSAVWFVTYTIAAIALTATRPFVYVPFAAATFAVAESVFRRDGKRLRCGVILTASALVIGLSYVALGSAMATPSLIDNLLWMKGRDLEIAAPLPSDFIRWYATRLAKTSLRLIVDCVSAVLPLVALAGYAVRRPRDVWLLAGAVAGSVLTLLLDPDSGDLSRTIEIPLYPVVLIGVVAATRYLIEDRSRRARIMRSGAAPTS